MPAVGICKIIKGGNMVRRLDVSIYIAGALCLLMLWHGQTPSLNSVGSMPEVIISAPRYEYEDEAWSGMVEEVVVTAQQPHPKDQTGSGLMDTVVVTASRYEGDEIITADALTTMKVNRAHSGMSEEHIARSLTRLVFVYGALFVVALVTLIWSMMVVR